MNKVLKRLYDQEALNLGLKLTKKIEGRKQRQYYITVEEWDAIKFARSQPNERLFVETLKKLDKNGNISSTVEKLQSEPIEIPEDFEAIKISTNKSSGQQWVQYAPKKEEEILKEIDFDSIIKKYSNPIIMTPEVKSSGGFDFDRLVYTDVHIGMTPNENGYSLYGGKWDEEEIIGSLDIMIEQVLNDQKSDTLIIDELGDFMDGYDGETVRKGHKLPQNMDNETAFDVGLHFKCRLIDSLAPHFKKIISNNICNDNHAGAFGYMVNKAAKGISNAKYSHVEVNNLRRFISHYMWGNRVFMLTHGKDGKNLKFGFKPILDAKQTEKIKNYIDEHFLLRPEVKLEFSKGDSHQKIFDETTSDAFNYYNYPAFSPSSEWVQTNFKKGLRGFEFFNYKSDGQKKHNPYLFDWNTNREEITIDFSI